MQKKLTASKEELYELYIVKGLKAREIAEMFGVDVSTVKKRLTKYGIKKYPEKNKKMIKLDKEYLFRKYWVEGKTTIEIAKELGCHNSTVLRWMKKYGIKRRPPCERVKEQKPATERIPKEVIYDLYIVENMPKTKVAQMLGISKGELSYLLRKYGIIKKHVKKKPIPYEELFIKYLKTLNVENATIKELCLKIRTIHSKGWLFKDEVEFENLLWEKIQRGRYRGNLRRAYKIFHEFLDTVPVNIDVSLLKPSFDVKTCVEKSKKRYCAYLGDCLEYFEYCPHTGKRVNKKLVKLIYDTIDGKYR